MYLRLVCQAKMNSVAGLQIARANDGNFYLVNRGNSNITISQPTELFGFNVGSYVEVPSEPLQGVRESIMKQHPVKLPQYYLTHNPGRAHTQTKSSLCPDQVHVPLQEM